MVIVLKTIQEMTLEEYEKVLEEKRKALLALKTEERKVAVDKELASMQQLSSKKDNNDIFVKLVKSVDSTWIFLFINSQLYLLWVTFDVLFRVLTRFSEMNWLKRKRNPKMYDGLPELFRDIVKPRGQICEPCTPTYYWHFFFLFLFCWSAHCFVFLLVCVVDLDFGSLWTGRLKTSGVSAPHNKDVLYIGVYSSRAHIESLNWTVLGQLLYGWSSYLDMACRKISFIHCKIFSELLFPGYWGFSKFA